MEEAEEKNMQQNKEKRMEEDEEKNMQQNKGKNIQQEDKIDKCLGEITEMKKGFNEMKKDVYEIKETLSELLKQKRKRKMKAIRKKKTTEIKNLKDQDDSE